MTGGQTNIIPLPTLDGDVALPRESSAAMRAAVIQVIHDLFIARVAPQERSPLYDAARDLLPQAGWGPLEMIEAAEPGPRQDALFRELGISPTNEAANDG
jgi:hypothetical protein